METKEHLKIVQRVLRKAIRNTSAVFTPEDKASMGAALGYFETFPYYLVSQTEEELDRLRQEADAWDELTAQKEQREAHFRMRELTYEAYYAAEYNRALGAYRSALTDTEEPRYNLNEAKALAAQDRLVKRYHKWWLWCKACRKEAAIIAKAFDKTGKSLVRKYHLAKDKAEGKLVAATGG